MPSPLLQAERVTVEFDGFVALRDLDFTLDEGELRFLIGPNGAGKSTLIDVISGRVRPKRGRVRFRGSVDLSRLPEHRIARLGIGRKFQTPAVYGGLTVWDNLAVALAARMSRRALARDLTPEERDTIRSVLAQLGLERWAHQRAGTLSHGQRQWLEIGMLLVQKLRLLLLDEPVAGMSQAERQRTGELLRRLAGERAILVVEHDMDFVRRFATRVTVMHEGQVLCDGPVEEVQRDHRVLETYIGRGRTLRPRRLATG